MKIIKKINTSAALALDASGHEVVVLGKGIGFPPTPYELTDLSKVERTFYDVDPRYLSMIAELSQPIVMACADIADQAEIELGNQLNPNLPFTLADHVQFAVERLKSGVDLTMPIAYDVRHLYPKETALADTALQILHDKAGLELPANEAVNIAMHFINAEAESGDIHSLMLSMQIISDVNKIVEESLHIKLDKELQLQPVRHPSALSVPAAAERRADQRCAPEPAQHPDAGIPGCVQLCPEGGGVLPRHLGLGLQR